jgi:hypothetical protein
MAAVAFGKLGAAVDPATALSSGKIYSGLTCMDAERGSSGWIAKWSVWLFRDVIVPEISTTTRLPRRRWAGRTEEGKPVSAAGTGWFGIGWLLFHESTDNVDLIGAGFNYVAPLARFSI